VQNTKLYKPDYSIYPGEYVPLLNEKEVSDQLKRKHKDDIIHPPVNMTELTESFKIEVAMPGIKREELLILANGNVISVYAIHKEKENGIHKRGNIRLHEFDCNCFDRHIILPENVDTEFVSAKFKEGILRMHVPKTKRPSKNVNTRIIVY